jgi:cobalt-zinc-cadmium efflux system membrane fusion protein
MEDGAQEQQRWPNRSWSLKTQLYALASLGALAGLVVFFAFFLSGGSEPATSPPSPKLATFVPSSQQLSSLGVQTVSTRPFRTEIVTDGYVAPNGGFAAVGKDGGPISHGLPVLAGQSSDVLQAESDLVSAGAQFRAAQANEARQHQLYDGQGAALKDWQQAQVDLATASAALTSARNRLRILGKSNAAIAAFEKDIPRSQDPGAGTAFAVGDLSTVWLVANVREVDAGMVHPGDDVQVRVPAFPNETFKAQVAFVSSVIDPATHRLVIGAEIHNTGEKLKPNMQASFTIFAGPPSNAPAVPQNALVYEGDDARVWVVDRHGDLNLRSVTTGRSDGNYMEITSGLSAGEQIVTSGALFVDQAANRT